MGGTCSAIAFGLKVRRMDLLEEIIFVSIPGLKSPLLFIQFLFEYYIMYEAKKRVKKEAGKTSKVEIIQLFLHQQLRYKSKKDENEK